MAHALLGSNPVIGERVLATLRQRARPGTRWAVFQNHALDSATLGHLQFLMVGEGCAFTERPERMPDNSFSLGWKYLPVGWVDLVKGIVVPDGEVS